MVVTFERLINALNVISGPCDFAQGDGGDVAQGDARMGTQKLRPLVLFRKSRGNSVGLTGYETVTVGGPPVKCRVDRI